MHLSTPPFGYKNCGACFGSGDDYKALHKYNYYKDCGSCKGKGIIPLPSVKLDENGNIIL